MIEVPEHITLKKTKDDIVCTSLGIGADILKVAKRIAARRLKDRKEGTICKVQITTYHPEKEDQP